jgi:hypothetical protein
LQLQVATSGAGDVAIMRSYKELMELILITGRNKCGLAGWI